MIHDPACFDQESFGNANAAILLGILAVVLLVSGSITYMENRKMNV